MTIQPEGARLKPAVLLALAILAVYGLLLGAPFLYDDVFYIPLNPLLTGPWPGLKALFLKPLDASGAYEPLITLQHRLLFGLFGDQVLPYRLSSLVLHWLNSLLVLELLARLLRERRLAFWGALLFALYPAHAEALAISTFKTHLSAAFLGLAILWLLEAPVPGAGAKLGLCWLLFALALFCKETALAIPLLALAARLRTAGREDPRGAPPAAPLYAGWGLIAAAYLALRLSFARRALVPLREGGLAGQLLLGGKILAWYLAELLAPVHRCLEHSYSTLGWGLGAGVLAPALAALLAAGAWGLWRLWRADRAAWLGAAWTLLALAPFLDLVPFLNYTPVSDRYLYLASAGFLLLALRGLDAALAGRRLSWAAARLGLGVAAAAYAAGALRHAALFSEPIELWSRTALCAPDNPRAQAAYGDSLIRHRLYAEGAAQFEKALRLDPGYAEPYLDLTLALDELGRPEDALKVAAARLALRPDALAWQNLGSAELKAGRPAAAREAFSKAEALAPSAELRYDLGRCELAQGRLAKAEELFRLAAEDRGIRGRALAGLGQTRLRRGDKKLALAAYEGSWAADPTQPAVAKALARLYAAAGRRQDAETVYSGLITSLRDSVEALGEADPARYGALRAYAAGAAADLARDRDSVLGPGR